MRHEMKSTGKKSLGVQVRFVAQLLVLVVLGAQPAVAAFLPGVNSRTLTHAGVLRDFDVYAPASYTGVQEVPVVVDLHGFSSDKGGHRGISGWTDKAETEGFLVVHPNGLFNSWNAGTCCGTAMTNGVDDVGFLRAVVEAVAAEGSVNAARIYVTGLSNGGAMSHRIACEAADVFAAAAPMAFPVPYTDFPNQCLPERPIPVLAFMGLSDVVIPYSNGFFGGALPSLDAWRTKNACGTGPLEVQETYGGSNCQVDTSCGGGAEVGLCSIRGSVLGGIFAVYSGHILYFNMDAVVLADRAWAFLDQFALPAAIIPVPEPGPLLLQAMALLMLLGLRKRRMASPL
jgi:polyhydroxybutyrate depolymerase